jgi:2-polyprenyl-3-methyl-5-hydroxy-6-metoxy-1,4-benzoquinol methylase
MEKLNQCPACGHAKQKDFLAATDYTVSKQRFSIVRCEACTLLFTNPRPRATEAGPFYQSDDYISHSNTQKGFINALYHKVRTITLRQKTSWIKDYQIGTKELLDIGCGNGHFLHACQQTGWNISGMELDPATAQRASELTQKPIYANLSEIPADKKFQVISLWHVLEHVYELEEYFTFFKARIQPGGKLIFALPNSKSFDARYFGEFWAAYDVPRHIYHFDPTTITSLAARYGFRLTKQRGQVFDSFYIALLSHQYKTGSKKILMSFLLGLWSNILAWTKTGNYSSNLYIFEHV